MNRRRFLVQAGAAASVAACFHRGMAQGGASVSTELALREMPGAQPIPLTFNGLSYESAELSDPTFFSASNRDLVAYFRLLSPHGVLRIGGNTSEFCWFKSSESTPQPKLRLPAGNLDANWMPHRQFAITPEAIKELAGFLDATGWRAIYGLNLGNGTPQRAAAEAAYVARALKDRLEFFQIGNEPDDYHEASHRTRPSNWGFDDYLREWTGFAEAVAASVPEVRLGGPDTGSFDWVVRFGNELPAAIDSRVAALTKHYYAEGPPDDPQVTIRRLLEGIPQLPSETRKIVTIARAEGRIYRMTEGNTCFRGGKPGMSNAFASALWAGDFMLQLATLGCAGVNLHGGSSAIITAGLGNHSPGLKVAKGPQTMRGGFYTPIFSQQGEATRAMPIFYGMLLANQLAGGKPLNVEGSLEGVNATAYAVTHDQGVKIAIFNKDERNAVEVSIRAPHKVQAATAWRMQAPRLDSTQGVTLAGAQIQTHAQWSPKAAEPVEVKNGIPRIRIPAASAALLFLN